MPPLNKIIIRPSWTFSTAAGERVDPRLFDLLRAIHDSGKLTLAAKTVNPSFLALHPNGKLLYAVNESGDYQGKPQGAVSAFKINADGTLTVPAGTAAGNYTVTYEICEVLNPANCDTAEVDLVIAAAAIVATDDDFTGTPVNGLAGGDTATVFTNDTLNGVAFANGDVTASITIDGGLTGVSINADGTLTIPAGTAAGNYTVTYEICEVLNGRAHD